MALFSSMTWADLAVIFLLSALTYYVALIVYRLWFHPIADFPGPFLARTTFWYEFYYSYVRVGAYYLKVKEMHEKYGTYAIHILVGENLTCPRTHCQDNARWTSHQWTNVLSWSICLLCGQKDQQLSQSWWRNRFRRWISSSLDPFCVESLISLDMTAVSSTHNMHRASRAPLDPFFSKAGVLKLEQRVLARIEKMCARLRLIQGTGQVVNLFNAISSLTTGKEKMISENKSTSLTDGNC